MRQCWEDNGIYRYNQLGSDWVLRQLGANTPLYDTIIELYKIAPGEKNAEKMHNMGVVATGWCFTDFGRVEDAEFAYLRARSECADGSMLTARLHPDRSDIGSEWFRPGAGIVPFGVMDEKVSA